ncbi:podoplanin isoform X1 [Callorhinchus milii]|uniref:podoplanin isoform X1 n=1 Tax=Callorhinchus milii TaxID=7868 RepID=UPI0004573B3C|nr:podoplanin isoform X1 [Callorhinchus milii]|eukprot:gi/632959990/ref/XP_007895941.1/ PREDICTED: podoplanin isoform X1 [Callorhinchus milii]
MVKVGIRHLAFLSFSVFLCVSTQTASEGGSVAVTAGPGVGGSDEKQNATVSEMSLPTAREESESESGEDSSESSTTSSSESNETNSTEDFRPDFDDAEGSFCRDHPSCLWKDFLETLTLIGIIIGAIIAVIIILTIIVFIIKKMSGGYSP